MCFNPSYILSLFNKKTICKKNGELINTSCKNVVLVNLIFLKKRMFKNKKNKIANVAGLTKGSRLATTPSMVS